MRQPEPAREQAPPAPHTTRAASEPLPALRQACTQRGVTTDGARLLHHYSNAIFHLPDSDLIARVTDGADPTGRLGRAQQVTAWLVDCHGFPATMPADLDPVQLPHATVTFWHYHRQPDPAPPLTSHHLGHLLNKLHSIHGVSTPGLDTWLPLASLASALNDPALSGLLPAAEHAWLHDEVTRVRHECDQLDSPLGHGLIHGDAWAGNLLWNDDGNSAAPILGDWDWVSYGPREIDLIPTWHATTRYGRGRQWIDDFTQQYGHDLSNWSGLATLMRMRDLVQLTGPLRRSRNSQKHEAIFRQRFDAIRTGDTTTWRAL